MADRLTGKRGPAASGQYGGAIPIGHLDNGLNVTLVAREDNADGFDLVHGGVGGIEKAGDLVESDLPFDPFLELRSDIPILL